jgi:excinuclease UvrABC nuclease subunit
MLRVSSIDELPSVPAVYVLFGGKRGSRYLAYVGIADKLKNRIEQHRSIVCSLHQPAPRAFTDFKALVM